MRVIKKPIFLSINEVYAICVNGISSRNEKMELYSIKDTVYIDSKRYDTYAKNKMLFVLQPLNTLYSESQKKVIHESDGFFKERRTKGI